MRSFPLFLTAALVSLFSCIQKKNGSENTMEVSLPMTKPVDSVQVTPAQKERRAQSEAYCLSRGIPVYQNPNSLFVDSDEDVLIRDKNEIVDRALALCYIALKGEGPEQHHLDRMHNDYAISVKLSPVETQYATAKNPTQQQSIDAKWRYESLHVMLWALSFVDSLRYPDQVCNVGHDVKIIYELSEEKFRKRAKLRSKKEILDQADLILRIDWACVSAQLENNPPPSRLDRSVVYERHYALNWLIRYFDQAWDDVTTDT